ncbi:C-type mannose receptor 2-like isoform X1 [Alosa pseudoharengus]|uniref:C-type mannose receptor 2-like isoform X1 n=1 Tax=Alosa pseudoharengus TaxID=34774 RepID=UPI003F8BB9C1
MATAVVTLLFLSGLFSSCHGQAGQYHYVSNQLNWTEAQNYCRTHYSDLVTIRSQAEHTRFKTYLGDQGKKSIWIGLYNDIKSWRWSLDDNGLEQIGFSNWSKGEPDNKLGVQSCGDFYDGAWSDTSCTIQYPFICYDEKESAAKYILISKPKSWNDAQEYCREHHTDLASSRNQEENRWLASSSDNRTVWIGLFRDTWKWSDQSKIRFTAWHPNYPSNNRVNDDCAGYSNGYWYDRLCPNRYNFVCQSGKCSTSMHLNYLCLQCFFCVRSQIGNQEQIQSNSQRTNLFNNNSDGRQKHSTGTGRVHRQTGSQVQANNPDRAGRGLVQRQAEFTGRQAGRQTDSGKQSKTTGRRLGQKQAGSRGLLHKTRIRD